MKCFLCDREWTIKFMDWNDVETSLCPECAKKLLNNNNCIIYKWVVYSNTNPNITICNGCWAFVHREQAAIQGWRCVMCAASRFYLKKKWIEAEWHYCPDCWAIHQHWICPTWMTDEVKTSNYLSFQIGNENKSWHPKWESLNKSSYVKKIWQFQTERELRESDVELLEKFYCHWKKFSHYYTREPINIEWEVSYYNYRVITRIQDYLMEIREDAKVDIQDCIKVSKYYNYYLKWLDDTWLIKWQFIDLMWNIRERSESINKFLQDIWQKADNCNMFCKFKYRLSSALDHKISAFKLNEKVASCQKSGNCESYARWAYDAITNWCNCPLLIYTTDNKLIARITTRIMYDEEWQEYILIDRIYHSWEFSDQMMKWEIYKSIVKDLKDKWYKVIASPYSAHDRSTYAYLYSLWLKSVWEVHNLCQPLRRLIGDFGYYCDWGTEVYTGEIDWLKRATDYLDKAYLF